MREKRSPVRPDNLKHTGCREDANQSSMLARRLTTCVNLTSIILEQHTEIYLAAIRSKGAKSKMHPLLEEPPSIYLTSGEVPAAGHLQHLALQSEPALPKYNHLDKKQPLWHHDESELLRWSLPRSVSRSDEPEFRDLE